MGNITVGPALEIGGNTVEMTTKGKVQVTNSKGRIKTLSQDEFKKNIAKNADKIEAGEDFEFKKDHKGLKIAAAAVATAAVVTAAIYHKEIGKYMKDFSFKKLWKDIKGLFTSEAKKIRAEKRNAKYSMQAAKNDAHRYFAKNADVINLTEAERSQKMFDSLQAFSAPNFNPEKSWQARTDLLKSANVTEEQLSLMQKISHLPKGASISAQDKAMLPEGFESKKACNEFLKKVRNAMMQK